MPEAPEIIRDLVEKFERNYKSYKSSSYNEAQVRQEFINPFFKALGWDIYNESNAAPPYRDVIFEDSIKVAGGTRAPDYCFTLSGRRMFFVEAKKPSSNLKEDKRHAYQLRRYAWSAKLPLSILTDFEEFSVYESRIGPRKTDRASTERVLYYTYEDYIEKWDEISSIFSYESVRTGSFDKYAEETKKKRGTQEVDDAFLLDMEAWRELLAKNIALRNKELTIEELNYAVQKVIDRIIFLRMGEDRGLEKYGKLKKLLDSDNIYETFCELCRDADIKYNSGLFYFTKEKGRGTYPDQLTLDLNIDNKVLKNIIKGLYYPDSPYEFSVLSPEILGNIYEQFLGKRIRLTPSHMAKVEEKPEVKKAGGVYYTPQFIVDNIVENTVGRLCKGKTPNKVAKLKILDPACGSGSFLLGAYDYLLKWHLNYYIYLKDKKRLKKRIYLGKDGEWHLTIQEKKEILLNNIYGVDIDPQAVEVTKLSLLLKVLEGESRDVLETQQKLIKERALPDLGGNIKYGNSLVGPEIPEEDIEGIEKINFFDWYTEFARIMDNGGFDAIIGNPPYIRIQAMKQWAPIEVEFYKKKYTSAKWNYDIYVLFVERSLELLNPYGFLGFILPHKFFNARYGQGLRSLIADGKYLDKIVHFGHLQIFTGSSTYSCLLFLNKKSNKSFEFVKVENLERWINLEKYGNKHKLKFDFKDIEEWNIIYGPESNIFNKLKKHTLSLGDLTRIFQGLTTGKNKIFILSFVSKNTDFVNLINYNGQEFQLEKEILRPLIKNISLSSYGTPKANHCIIFPYKIENKKGKLIDIKEIKSNYPKTYDYLLKYKKELLNKSNTNYNNWWGYSYPKNLDSHDSEKLIVQVISKHGRYAHDNLGVYFTGGGGGPYYGILLKSTEKKYSIHYLQGILNSRLADFYLHRVSTTFRGGYWQYGKTHIEKIPIKDIIFDNSEDVALHDKLVSLVEDMIQLNKKLDSARISSDIKLIKRQIDVKDKQIDDLVYKLYGLTDEEIRIVEDSSKD